MATRLSIAALAQAAKVSEPTVNRFCRSFSVSGYPELKLQLAQASTVSLNIPLPEDTDIYMPMTSRIIQLTVLDVLATGMTL
ncbi:hypothetical protein DNF23_58640, partial [Pseudomonas syringae pv. pisi]